MNKQSPNGSRNGNGHNNGNGLSALPDETLIKKISRRQQPALKELYGRHSRMLRSVVESLVHEGAEADDVLQEIFLQIWKEAHNYSPKAGKPLGWIVTIAKRRAIDRLRRRQAYSRARERYGDELRNQPLRPRRDAERVFVLGDLRTFLQNRMRNLPPIQRKAIDLAFFKGLSHREIAIATRAPLGTVKTRLELGLQKLTQSIKPLGNRI
ncbi:MAG: sigma-70 family RNA polymerase sigma factor [Verrucomicrobiota bacterium]